jgi:hypothetical protein
MMKRTPRLTLEQRLRLWDAVWRTHLLPLTHQAPNTEKQEEADKAA